MKRPRVKRLANGKQEICKVKSGSVTPLFYRAHCKSLQQTSSQFDQTCILNQYWDNRKFKFFNKVGRVG